MEKFLERQKIHTNNYVDFANCYKVGGRSIALQVKGAEEALMYIFFKSGHV